TVIQTVFSMFVVTGYLGIAILIKYLLNLWLVPLLGITGSALATVLSLLVLTGLLMWKLKQYLPFHQFFKYIHYRAFFLGLGLMSGLLFTLKYLMDPLSLSRYLLAVTVLFFILIGVVSYLAILLKYRVFSMKQLQVL